MMKNKILAIMLVVSMALLFTGISLGDVYLATQKTVASPDTWTVSSLRIENGGSLTVNFGATFIDTDGETFMAANGKYSDMTASMYVYGDATVNEFKMGQYEISLDGNKDPIVGSDGDTATLVVGNGTQTATMQVKWFEPGSNGGVANITINEFGTLTLTHGGQAGTNARIDLLGGTLRVYTGVDNWGFSGTDRIFGRGGLPIACGGVIVDTETEAGYTLYTANTTTNEVPTITAAPDYELLKLNGDPNTFDISAIVTDDDGFGNHTYTWSVLDAPEDDPNAVIFDPNDSLVTQVTFNTVGNYILEVTVTDDDGTENGKFCVHDTVNFYADGCEAAKGEDDYDVAAALFIGDRNHDCEVNLADFAIMASTWLTEFDLADFDVMALNWLTNVSK
jgi:hypothetical protein